MIDKFWCVFMPHLKLPTRRQAMNDIHFRCHQKIDTQPRSTLYVLDSARVHSSF